MDRGTSQHARGDRPRGTGLVLVGALALLAGCAHPKPLDQELSPPPAAGRPDPAVLARYQVGCPDVLELETVNRPDLTGLRPVGADGRIDLGLAGRVRVEGMTAAEVARCVAREVEVPATAVTVRVAEHNSQKVYLYGEVSGMQRPVAYVGPEPVLDLLRRAGGVTEGAAVGNVQVIRPHVIDGGSPEVFRVDVEAVLHGRDTTSNVLVEPFDQVHVGQSQKKRVEKVVAPCLRPLYEAVSGLRRQSP
jgi:protein involved in polysaccharide export with SLBB domain